jgi:hypothetical protein
MEEEKIYQPIEINEKIKDSVLDETIYFHEGNNVKQINITSKIENENGMVVSFMTLG